MKWDQTLTGDSERYHWRLNLRAAARRSFDNASLRRSWTLTNVEAGCRLRKFAPRARASAGSCKLAPDLEAACDFLRRTRDW